VALCTIISEEFAGLGRAVVTISGDTRGGDTTWGCILYHQWPKL